MTAVLGAEGFRDALDASLTLMRARREAIDTANVYPVPDGDTGTNLVLTLESVDAALRTTPDDPVRAIRTGSLMGARGNSGVILAQILRGMTDAIDGAPGDPDRVARAFKRATELAYESVLEPAEGTILTVMRAASDAAQGGHAGVTAQFEAAHAAALEALARTPEQLPALARAGVVDAGGMGLVAVLEGFASSLAGRRMDEPAPRPVPAPPISDEPSLEHAFEVQYLLEAPEATIDPLRALLGTIGDSVVVIGGEGLWRVHVHTDERDRAIAYGSAIGPVTDVEVVAFAEQIAARGAPAAAPSPGERGVSIERSPDAASLVAVASGNGVRAMFADLGAIVVDGGATMNPSVGDLLAGIERAPTDAVVVLPNNENVFAAAAVAVEQSPKRVTVLRTGDIAEGLVAAVAYGDSLPADRTIAEMQAAIDRARTGQVVIATRDADTPVGHVEAGQPIGFAEGAFVAGVFERDAPERDPVEMCVAVARELMTPDASVVTILCGAEADASERARLEPALRVLGARLQIDVLDGGQPVHRYLVSVE